MLLTNVYLILQTLLEQHEEDIEKWYFNQGESDAKIKSSSLEDYLCREGRVLKRKEDRKCLDEKLVNKTKETANNKKKA